ncbi:MAG: serine/threonine-protein kinase [Planctomycetota bacterium]|nr:serine/threonine-protein kinase [Planctomycetota bacterium]
MKAGAIIGDYRVMQRIGQGGMGAVYKVEKDNVAYALKTLLPEYAEKNALARFEREALAAAAVDTHPNIVSIHKLELHSRPPFIVMSYIEGKSLNQLIQRGKAWTPGQALGFVSPLAHALDHMHSKGIIHRDLKPANILVREQDGAPMITDFGIAKEGSLETLTKTGAMLGTPGYMAPEQFTSEEEPSSQMDVWALAVVVYELLSGGKPPFTGESTLALAQDTLESKPRSLRHFNASCTKDIETVILKALSKEPSDRYKRCGHFFDDFERAVQGRAILGRRVGFVKRQRRLIYQKLGPVGLAMLFLIFAAPILTALTFSDSLFQNLASNFESTISIDEAAQFLKEQKDAYSDHVQQHILWELGAPETEKELCAEICENSILLYRNSTESKQKKLALHFLPCYPNNKGRDRLIEKLEESDRSLLRAYSFLRKGEFQLAKQSDPHGTVSYNKQVLKLLLLAIRYKLKDYPAASEY